MSNLGGAPVRCPFLHPGMGTLLSGCPGFAPERVRFEGPGAGLADQVSCAHLGPEPSRRGFVGACHHPVHPRLLEVVASFRRAMAPLPWVDRDSLPAALIATDGTGHITQWNVAAEGLYGWRREEVWGRDIRELLVGPRDLVVAEQIMSQVISGRAWWGEFEVVRRTGEPLRVEVIDLPVVEDEGAVVGVVGLSAPAGALRRSDWDSILASVPGGVPL